MVLVVDPELLLLNILLSFPISITGIPKYYGGGGGGGTWSSDGTPGNGGLGGGGKGGKDLRYGTGILPQDGSANTGGGGGGAAWTNTGAGNGGSGVIIIKYPNFVSYNNTTNYTVTFANNVFVVQDSSSTILTDPITLSTGNVYIFDQSESSNSGTTFKLFNPRNTEITSDIIKYGTPGTLNAYTMISPSSTLSTVYFNINIQFYFVKVIYNAISQPVFAISTNSSGTYNAQLNIDFSTGTRYKFDVSDPSVAGFNLVFGTVDGSYIETTNSSLYSVVGTPGTTGAYVMLDVAAGYSGPTIRYFEDSSKNMGYMSIPTVNVTSSYTVTVQNSVFYLNGVSNPTITFNASSTYIFDQSDLTNASKQIVFIRPTSNQLLTTADGVTIFGTPGNSGAYTRLVLPSTFTGTLKYTSYTVLISISSLVADFDATVNVTSNNNDVSSWKDRYENITATAGSYKPKLTANYINTYPAIDFSSVSRSILITNITDSSTNALTMFFVMKVSNKIADANGNQFNEFFSSDINAGSGLLYGSIISGKIYITANLGGTYYDYISYDISNSRTYDTPFLLTITINTSINGTMTSKYNGTRNADFSFNNTSVALAKLNTYFDIGNWSKDTLRTLKGGIGEFVYYHKVLSASEIEKVEGYLAWKWGLQSSLPVGHNYKASAPT
jgi:hypothetical protein